MFFMKALILVCNCFYTVKGYINKKDSELPRLPIIGNIYLFFHVFAQMLFFRSVEDVCLRRKSIKNKENH